MINKLLECFILLLFIVTISSCVTSRAYEDALLVGKGNHAAEGTLSRAIFLGVNNRSEIANFIDNRDVGTLGLNYIYGASDRMDVSVGIDLPVGIHTKFKYNLDPNALRHNQALSFETRLPLSYLGLENNRGSILLSAVPTYLYTYRVDDLFSFSVNSFVNTTITTNGYFILPGVAAGIGVGNEVRFTAGINYSRSVFASDESRFQFITVESSIKYDF